MAEAVRHGLSHLGTDVGVGVVAGFLSDYSRQLTDGTLELRTHIAEITQRTETINARVAMARLQMKRAARSSPKTGRPRGR